MSVSSFPRLFITFCEFNRRRRELELLGKSEPEILSRWHEALDSLAVFYQNPSERELVVRALADPYFPFSKLVHLGGVFLSPTRNLANNNRMVRHINPWNAPVKVHTYEEYEDEFRDKMIEAGIPVEHPERATKE